MRQYLPAMISTASFNCFCLPNVHQIKYFQFPIDCTLYAGRFIKTQSKHQKKVQMTLLSRQKKKKKKKKKENIHV